jgi:uncharacterized YigZ family protein
MKNIIDGLRKEYHDARHHCYAYMIGYQKIVWRINDDGEPSGTAGRPIYGQIQSNKLTNILLVVIRYFGGTLLGVSGLIQAYKKAANDAILNAEIVSRHVEHILEICFDYFVMNDLMLLIKAEQLEIVNSSFDLQCSIRLKVRSALLIEVLTKMEKMEGVISSEVTQE